MSKAVLPFLEFKANGSRRRWKRHEVGRDSVTVNIDGNLSRQNGDGNHTAQKIVK